MKRSDLIRSIQVQFKRMRPADAAAMLDAITDQVVESVANGDRIELRGFGTFEPRARAAKIGLNPATGKQIQVAAGRTILFRPSKELIKKMN